MRWLALLVFLVIPTLACSSEGDVGESCDALGQGSGECKSGLVCAIPGPGAVGPACMPLCLRDEDCRPDQECNGISGTNVKACRFKK